MNPFKILKVPVSVFIDEEDLEEAFILESEKNQKDEIKLASINQAYELLSNEYTKIIEYIKAKHNVDLSQDIIVKNSDKLEVIMEMTEDQESGKKIAPRLYPIIMDVRRLIESEIEKSDKQGEVTQELKDAISEFRYLYKLEENLPF